MKVQFKDVKLRKLKAAANDKPKKSKGKGSKKTASLPNWIWLKNDKGQSIQNVVFRKEFELSGAVKKARLYLAADNHAKVFVDGTEVLQSKDWSRIVFKDISPLLTQEKGKSKHVIAVEARNSEEVGTAGLLLKLAVDSGWRNSWTIQSDASWSASPKAAKGWKTTGFKGKWQTAQTIAPLGGGAWKTVTANTLKNASELREPTATAVESIKVAKGFKVDLLYSVPKAVQGSWVNMCTVPDGRLVVSDQYGGLYYVSLPDIGDNKKLKIDKINVDIGEAQGLLWAFDSLYVVVNRGRKYDSGVYRVKDTDGDGDVDKLETLRKLDGGGEHGPHAILVAPDQKSLYVVCGNGTKLTEIASSRVPQVWDEDLLLPRTHGRGFMRGRTAPGGYISRIDPDGKNWELVATGFRNEFDAALNANGDLFTYDADMEWDLNTPWYRPTRICHVVSGAEFGWRNGSGKWPSYYPDSLPGTVDIGPGSPTGVCFGYGAKFPAKYQRAMFINDWSYGKMYAVHFTPNGSSYSAVAEEFMSASPLPLTDVIIHPQDGALYFAIGGRNVQSGLYKVTYTGKESTQPAELEDASGKEARATRQALEQLHVGDHANAVATAWTHLSSNDRFLRNSARVAIERRPVSEWQDKALSENNPTASLTAIIALARQYKRPAKAPKTGIDTAAPNWEQLASSEEFAKRSALTNKVLARLDQLNWNDLSVSNQIALLRAYTLTFVRLGPPSSETRKHLIQKFDSHLPAKAHELNSELTQLLVHLQAPNAATKGVALLSAAPTQEEQIDLAKTLRHLNVGWTNELQEEYFHWFVKAGGFRGGASFGMFVQNIKKDAVKKLSGEQKTALKPILEAKLEGQSNPIAAKPRPIVKEWKMQELQPMVASGLKGRDFDNGRKLFGEANCFACHRFDGQGGAVGPDLTALAGRFSSRDIFESVVDPSKVISDQYAAVQIRTFDGKVVTGRIVNLANDSFRISENLLDPSNLTAVDRREIDEMQASKISMMPVGLLNTLNENEILDLMAYLLSRGDRNHSMFQGK